MQDRVKEVLESLRKEWGLGELLALQTGIENMLRRQQQSAEEKEAEEIAQGNSIYGDVEEYIRQERGAWVRPMYEEVMEQVKLFSMEGQFRFWEELGQYIRREIENEHAGSKCIEGPQYHSITELRGIGKEFWQGIDVEKYIEEERSSW